MKKFIRYLLIACFILVATLCCSSCGRYNTNKEEEYYYKINSLIKSYDFASAFVYESKIVLNNAQNEIIKEILFEDYDADINPLRIYKSNDIVFFVVGGAVDDEYGIMFINNDVNNILDGVKSIERIGGNSYRYSTVE